MKKGEREGAKYEGKRRRRGDDEKGGGEKYFGYSTVFT